jgi:hypothetical protein
MTQTPLADGAPVASARARNALRLTVPSGTIISQNVSGAEHYMRAEKNKESIMKSASLWIVLALMVFLFPLGIRAQEKPEKAATDWRQEMAELKQLVARISTRLDNIERRLSQLERVGPSERAPAGMRPLGRRLMVDENGVIYDGKIPVGFWGINGGGPRQSEF